MIRPRNSNDFIRAVLSLMRKQPWLREHGYEDGLMALVDECETEEEQKLVFDLLHRFTYVEWENFAQVLEGFLDVIINEWGLDEQNTQLMAISRGHIPDSSQPVIYGLKAPLQRKGWSKAKLLNSADRPKKYLKTHPNIVLVDEFIGTGNTVISRIEHIKRTAISQSIDLDKVKIYICTIACSIVGKLLIETCNYPLHYQFLLGKGISDYYRNLQLDEQINNMKRLESILSRKYNETELPSFGYGQCESLYGRKDGNTPNNVFPIFWWPFKGTALEPRLTLLTRHMEDA